MRITRTQLRRLIKEQLEIEVVPEDAFVLVTDEVISGEEPEIFGHGGTAKMSRGQLFTIAQEAQSLHDRLADKDELPEWVQSKIAVMADNMQAVADHLNYKMHRHDLDEPVE